MVSARTLSSAELLRRFARDGRVFPWRPPLLTSAGAYRKRNDCKQEARLFEVVHNNGVAPSHGRVGWNGSPAAAMDLYQTVAPSHGRVGWNCEASRAVASRDVAPSHGRVGWNSRAAVYADGYGASRPLTGAWVGTSTSAASSARRASRALSRARGLELDLGAPGQAGHDVAPS